MTFIEYNSISNHTDKRTINEFFEAHPEYLDVKYIVEHKYDGANIQIIFMKNESEPQFCSRNCILTENDKFFGYKSVVKSKKYKEMFERVQKFLDSNEQIKQINLFGELYGTVQDRVKYFVSEIKENKLIFFDVYFDSKLQSQKEFIEWSSKLEIEIVENYLIGSYQECMSFDVSKIHTEHGSLIEGVVVKPYDTRFPTDCPFFYIKIKNSGFDEIKPTKQVEKKPNQTNQIEMQKYPGIELFKDYLTPNRARSAFSKKSWTKKEITNLANEILSDAKKDFDINNTNQPVFDVKLLQKFYLKEVFKLINDLNMFND